MDVLTKWTPLREYELKAAFDKARQDGKDFLMVAVHSTPQILTGDGAPLRLIQIHETPVGIGKDTMTEDLRAFTKAHGAYFNPGAVYPIGPSFEEARKGWSDLLPLDVFHVREELILEEAQAKIKAEQAAWNARPWYGKLAFWQRPEPAAA